MDKRKSWQDLRPGQRRAVVVAGVLGTVAQGAMLWDLWRRPADQIRGSKRAWFAASFVRPIGQLAYLRWGRTTEAPATAS